MSMSWIRESPAHWDAHKARIVGGAPVGVFDSRMKTCKVGDIIPGEWWRVEDGGKVVGYGWLDTVWGDAEILLATDPEVRGKGVGSFILDRLDVEARARGLGYLYNVVRPTHPNAEATARWFEKRGFRRGEDGRHTRLVRR